MKPIQNGKRMRKEYFTIDDRVLGRKIGTWRPAAAICSLRPPCPCFMSRLPRWSPCSSAKSWHLRWSTEAHSDCHVSRETKMNRRYAWRSGQGIGAGETAALFHVKQARRSVGTLETAKPPPLPAAPAIADPKRAGRWA